MAREELLEKKIDKETTMHIDIRGKEDLWKP
jgi:hypothetical protein